MRKSKAYNYNGSKRYFPIRCNSYAIFSLTRLPRLNQLFSYSIMKFDSQLVPTKNVVKEGGTQMLQGFYYSHISSAGTHPHMLFRHHNKLTRLILVGKNNGKINPYWCSFFSPFVHQPHIESNQQNKIKSQIFLNIYITVKNLRCLYSKTIVFQGSM